MPLAQHDDENQLEQIGHQGRELHNMDLRFAAFVGFVLHNDAHYDVRILCARLRPLMLNNLQLFGLCEHSLH
jgi:hypothetical protein